MSCSYTEAKCGKDRELVGDPKQCPDSMSRGIVVGIRLVFSREGRLACVEEQHTGLGEQGYRHVGFYR